MLLRARLTDSMRPEVEVRAVFEDAEGDTAHVLVFVVALAQSDSEYLLIRHR